jgi:hypothetical protein
MVAKLWDLVQTPDGYFGIVVAENEVFLGNGLQAVMRPEEFAQLRVCPITPEGAAPSNFFELITRGPIKDRLNAFDMPREGLDPHEEDDKEGTEAPPGPT